MRKLLYLAVTVVLAVAGALPVNSAEPMNGLSMSSDETTPDVTVTVSINERRGANGWYGSYVINFANRAHPSGIDYLHLSSSRFMIESNAEVTIPLNGDVMSVSGSFFLPDTEDPDGFHNLGTHGPPDHNPFGTLNIMLKGEKPGNFDNETRVFTVMLNVIDKRPYGTPPNNYGISYGFMDYKTHLFTSDMN